MSAIGEYLISVVAVCMLVVPAMQFVRKELPKKAVRLVSGLLVLLVAIRPLLHLDLGSLSDSILSLGESYSLDADDLREEAREQLASRVKQSTKQLIMNKATEQGITLQVEVTVSKDEYPVPTKVKLIGTATLEQVEAVSSYIEEAFHLTGNQQEWVIYG